jgi:hypothetical protein
MLHRSTRLPRIKNPFSRWFGINAASKLHPMFRKTGSTHGTTVDLSSSRWPARAIPKPVRLSVIRAWSRGHTTQPESKPFRGIQLGSQEDFGRLPFAYLFLWYNHDSQGTMGLKYMCQTKLLNCIDKLRWRKQERDIKNKTNIREGKHDKNGWERVENGIVALKQKACSSALPIRSSSRTSVAAAPPRRSLVGHALPNSAYFKQ